ncbi:MAG: hypothetical protein JJ863_37095 [Deltaproteobacteria bacterium]|nr:hypothetical protein [Deltaproteobacteria bacterium]
MGPSATRLRSLVSSLAIVAAGCVLDDVTLEGLECPCADGWVCDEARNLCVESLEPDGGPVDAGDPTVDAGLEEDGGPSGDDGGPTDAFSPDEGVDAFSPFTTIPDGASLRVDVGPTESAGWPSLLDNGMMVGPVGTVEGDPTDVTFAAAGFTGTQTMGAASNDFGWPLTASQDSLWVGSFDGHDAALLERGTITVSSLPPGRYRVVLFASRTGDDAGIGRLTRYTIDGTQQELEVSDNTSDRAMFTGVSPDAAGDLEIAVEVSPNGTGRFGYIGVAIITREGA